MLITNDKKNYVYVLSDGTLRVSVPEGTPNAVRREFEKSDKTTGVKHELVYDALTGTITNVSLFDGDYGKLLQIQIEDKGGAVYLSLSTVGSFGEDFMKKLPNVKLDQEVKIVPYSFEDDNGKIKKGITLYQNKKKVPNYFFDAEKKESINGYPVPKGDVNKFDSDDWKLFYIGARKFLIEYTEKNCPLFNKEQPVEAEVPTTGEADEDFDVAKEIPF